MPESHRTGRDAKPFIHPEVFERLRITARSMGFRHVASAPLVRSSMNAEDMYNT